MAHIRSNPNIDAECRSLLQKAVRRSDAKVARSATIRLLENNETIWLRNRLGVIAFEECWHNTERLSFNLNPSSLILQYEDLAESKKNKNAAGLGSLAYELSLGATTTLLKNDENNRHLKIICEAIKRPNDFWSWINALEKTEQQKKITHLAEHGFKLAGWPWDKAFAVSTAYLSVTENIPNYTSIKDKNPQPFPYWVAIDKHTPEGKKALASCGKQLRIDKETLGWIQFYFESASCYQLDDCYWWDREKTWRFGNLGLSMDEADQIWKEASILIKDLLEPQQTKLMERLLMSEQRYTMTINTQEKLI